MSSVSVNGAPDAGENTRFIVLISCVATIGGFLFGFDSGVINGTVDGLKQTFNSSAAETGFEVASMLLGCAIGAFFAGRLADRWAAARSRSFLRHCSCSRPLAPVPRTVPASSSSLA